MAKVLNVAQRQMLEGYVEGLNAMPGVHADMTPTAAAAIDTDQSCDAMVDLSLAGRFFVVHIEVKKSVYPRDVLQILRQHREMEHGRMKGKGEERIVVVVAESISPGAKELLKSENVGYYDSGGSLYFPASGVYLYVDMPPPKALSKSIRTLFSGRRSQVLQVLLAQRRRWFGVKELAQLAEVSPATTSQVMKELEKFSWVTSRGRGPNKERHLDEPTQLLDAWAKQLG